MNLTPEEISNESFKLGILIAKAMDNNDWGRFENALCNDPSVMRSRVNLSGDTFLHIATSYVNVRFVRNLVMMMPPQDLEVKNNIGTTAFEAAVVRGIKEIVEIMVHKNSNLVMIRTSKNVLPVVAAARSGNKDLVKYLYSMTPLSELSAETSRDGVSLLTNAIVTDMYDVALDLLHHYPKLVLPKDYYGLNAISLLAKRPSAFPSGFHQKGIFKCRYKNSNSIIYV
ncbi:hypothetical protein IFM89_001083 [Coptis chinensis]|uniref:Ankyrin repeat protein n=1 Tax=Coptis chinensis TaxID=261450 RepID=A0A835LP17_9MAGN|nr:hypothetical protein IFM89_001083 [Coptis chinensis]